MPFKERIAFATKNVHIVSSHKLKAPQKKTIKFLKVVKKEDKVLKSSNLDQ